VAFKLGKTGQYEPYAGQQGYDADFFVVIAKLAGSLAIREPLAALTHVHERTSGAISSRLMRLGRLQIRQPEAGD
jgi:hypothetical protein